MKFYLISDNVDTEMGLRLVGIEGEVVSVGMMDRVEVWSKEKWEAYNESEMDMDAIAEKMNELGI